MILAAEELIGKLTHLSARLVNSNLLGGISRSHKSIRLRSNKVITGRIYAGPIKDRCQQGRGPKGGRGDAPVGGAVYQDSRSVKAGGAS